MILMKIIMKTNHRHPASSAASAALSSRSPSRSTRKGIVFTIDAIIGLLVVLLALGIAAAYWQGFAVDKTTNYVEQVSLRQVAEDWLAGAETTGLLANPDKKSVKDAFSALPDNVCLRLEILRNATTLIYSQEKPGCKQTSENYRVAFHTVAVPTTNRNTDFYMARATAWYLENQPAQEGD